MGRSGIKSRGISISLRRMEIPIRGSLIVSPSAITSQKDESSGSGSGSGIYVSRVREASGRSRTGSPSSLRGAYGGEDFLQRSGIDGSGIITKRRTNELHK